MPHDDTPTVTRRQLIANAIVVGGLGGAVVVGDPTDPCQGGTGYGCDGFGSGGYGR